MTSEAFSDVLFFEAAMNLPRFVRVIVPNSAGCAIAVWHLEVGREGWNFPGGKVEPGEDPKCAALRETFEEVGLNVTGLRLIHEGEYLFKDVGPCYGYFYVTDPIDTLPQNREPGKLARVEVLSPEAIVKDAELPFVGKMLGLCFPQKEVGTVRNGFVQRHHASLTIVPDWSEFVEWVADGGYDESYLDVNDSKCMALQEQFLAEANDVFSAA